MRKHRIDSLLTMLTLSAFLFSFAASASAVPISTADTPQPAAAAAAPQPIAVTPVSKPDEKWQNRNAAINARVKEGNVDMIFIGDSITQGWEGRGKEVWKKYYDNRNAANLGISGDQTQHVLWRLENGNIDGISPKLAMIMIGTNNANAQQKPEDIAAGIKAIVKMLRDKLPNTRVLVLSIFPRGADDQDPKREQKIKADEINIKTNEIIAKLADNKMVFYLDIRDKFLDPDGKLSKDIMYDLLHLTDKGYSIWAESVEPTVTMLMSDKLPDVYSSPRYVNQGARTYCKKHHRAFCLARKRR